MDYNKDRMSELNGLLEDTRLVIWAAQPHDSTAVLKHMSRARRPVSISVCLGGYAGEYETSYVSDVDTFKYALESGLVDHQESVLLLGGIKHGVRPATLVYMDGLRIPDESLLQDCVVRIGGFREARLGESADLSGFTYDPVQNKLFIVDHSE